MIFLSGFMFQFFTSTNQLTEPLLEINSTVTVAYSGDIIFAEKSLHFLSNKTLQKLRKNIRANDHLLQKNLRYRRPTKKIRHIWLDKNTDRLYMLCSSLIDKRVITIDMIDFQQIQLQVKTLATDTCQYTLIEYLENNKIEYNMMNTEKSRWTHVSNKQNSHRKKVETALCKLKIFPKTIALLIIEFSGGSYIEKSKAQIHSNNLNNIHIDICQKKNKIILIKNEHNLNLKHHKHPCKKIEVEY